MFIIPLLPLNTQIMYFRQEVNGASYLSYDGGGEGTSVIHPAVHTGLCVQVSHVGEGPIQVKELPLGVAEATTFSGLRFESSGMEILRGHLTEGPSVINRASVIVQDVDPAAMIRDGCSEVLQ